MKTILFSLQFVKRTKAIKTIICISILLLIHAFSVAQGYLDKINISATYKPDTIITYPNVNFEYSPLSGDIKSIGKGYTGITANAKYLAFLANPALLNKKGYAIEFTNAQLALPQTTVETVNFIIDNEDELVSGAFITDFKNGLNKIRNANTTQDVEDGIEQMRESTAFANYFLDKIVGRTEEPMLQGFEVSPDLKIQYGNFGFSYYNTTRVGFKASAGNILKALSSIEIPENTEDIDTTKLFEIIKLLAFSFDSKGNIAPQALPRLYSFAVSDNVGSLNYGYQYSDQLSLGINIDLLYRRFSTELISSESTTSPLSESAKNFSHSRLMFNMGFGAIIKTNFGSEIGLVLKDIIPYKPIKSSVQIDRMEVEITSKDFQTLEDTLDLAVTYQDAIYSKPYSLKSTAQLNAEIYHPLTSWSDINLGWADILALNKTQYDSYLDRMRFGVEARILKETLAFRTGISNLKPTAGIGLNLKLKGFIFDFDFALAYDNIFNEYAYFGQIKLGYHKNNKIQFRKNKEI